LTSETIRFTFLRWLPALPCPSSLKWLTTMTDTLKTMYADHMYDLNLGAITQRMSNPMTRERFMQMRGGDSLGSLMSLVGEDYATTSISTTAN
jgi:hypothetical protein